MNSKFIDQEKIKREREREREQITMLHQLDYKMHQEKDF